MDRHNVSFFLNFVLYSFFCVCIIIQSYSIYWKLEQRQYITLSKFLVVKLTLFSSGKNKKSKRIYYTISSQSEVKRSVFNYKKGFISP